MNQSFGEREESVSRAFVTLADTLVDDYDVIDLLDRLAGFCVELLSADAAGIVLGDARRELRAVAASDEAARVMELLQLQSDEGPCLDCFQTAAPVSVADLAEAAGRWPTFAAAVAERSDFRSIHALPLRLRGRAIGALNLFANVPGPLPELDLALGQALADVATIGPQSQDQRRGTADRREGVRPRRGPGNGKCATRRASLKLSSEAGNRVHADTPNTTGPDVPPTVGDAVEINYRAVPTPFSGHGT